MSRTQSLWSSLLSFLRRDLSSFRGASIPKLPEVSLSTAEPAWLEQLASELDVKKLEQIRFRRAVLDWRDGFCVHIGAVANRSFRQFASHVDDEVGRVGLIQSLFFTKPAGEVLQTPFSTFVLADLVKAVKEAERSLAEILSKWPGTIWPPFSFTEQYFDRCLACIDDLGFKANNQEEIFERVENLIFDDEGLVETYRRQATSLVRKLIRISEAEVT